MKPMLNYVSAAMAVAVAFAGSTFAADLPKEGSYDITTCFTRTSNRILFSKTHTAWSYEETGVSLSNPPGGLFDNESIRCIGMGTSFEGKRTGNSACEAMNKDGDKRLTHFWYGSDGKQVREAVTGTGKYEGLVTNGTVQTLGPFPEIKAGTVQTCNRQTGTYKLK